MTSQPRRRRRYRKTQGRRVWVFSDVNRELRPEQIARIITAAGLEQARHEAEARAQREAASPENTVGEPERDAGERGDVDA